MIYNLIACSSSKARRTARTNCPPRASESESSCSLTTGNPHLPKAPPTRISVARPSNVFPVLMQETEVDPLEFPKNDFASMHDLELIA